MHAIAVALALAFVQTPLLGAPNCKKGKPCGNACIAVSKTCHVGVGGGGDRNVGAVVPPLEPSIPTESLQPGPVEAPARPAPKGVLGGFAKANAAAMECGRTHGASPNQTVKVRFSVESSGKTFDAAAMGLDRGTPLGECVVKATTSHLRFRTGVQALWMVQIDFDVGELAPLPADDSEDEPPVVAAEEPPKTTCRRDDFADFDDFVACRVEEQGITDEPRPTGPPPDPAEVARQSETAEARAELGRREREQAAARAQEDRRTKRIVLALGISGAVFDAAGLGLLGGAYASGEPAAPDDGPVCTVGKRCGNTCIAVEKTCHTFTGGGSANPALLWPGVAAVAVGTGLIIASVVVYSRRSARTLPLVVNLRGVGIRF